MLGIGIHLLLLQPLLADLRSHCSECQGVGMFCAETLESTVFLRVGVVTEILKQVSVQWTGGLECEVCLDQAFEAAAQKDFPPEQLRRGCVTATTAAFTRPLVLASRRSRSDILDIQLQFRPQEGFWSPEAPLCVQVNLAMLSEEIHYWLTRKVSRRRSITSSSSLHKLQDALDGNGCCRGKTVGERQNRNRLQNILIISFIEKCFMFY